jgi:hypothetical protein
MKPKDSWNGKHLMLVMTFYVLQKMFGGAAILQNVTNVLKRVTTDYKSKEKQGSLIAKQEGKYYFKFNNYFKS